jgi:D-lyxose ketol-isomerase
MITRDEYESAAARAREYLLRAGIVLTPEEAENIEVADFGLGDLNHTGLEIVTYVNTERCCAKELVLFPHQTCPEHRHPPVDGEPGKEETFRCRWGEVFLYVPGPATEAPACIPPPGSADHYHVWHEVRLRPGEQHTILPDTPHWFQAGPDGAVVSEFSTRSRDESDIFSDLRIARQPQIAQ